MGRLYLGFVVVSIVLSAKRQPRHPYAGYLDAGYQDTLAVGHRDAPPISVYREGNEVQFIITDIGVGIALEQLPLLFTRFYRVDKSRSRAGGGSGIGLTIAKHLVEAHGGRIWVKREGLGTGSTFGFSLPISI